MFSTPETSVHVLDKNREISRLEREEGYGGKDLEKRWVLRREWKTLWDTPTTDLGAESEPGDEGEHSEEADWQVNDYWNENNLTVINGNENDVDSQNENNIKNKNDVLQNIKTRTFLMKRKDNVNDYYREDY